MENDLENRLQAALDACARMQGQRDQLAVQLNEATEQCWVMAEVMRDAFAYIDDDQDHSIETGKPLPDNCASLLSRIDAALTGKLPERPDTEWSEAASSPTEQDYRELQAQHDQLQSKHKAALDMLREMLGFVDGPKWQALIDERKAHDWLGRIEALLAGQVPAAAVTFTETIRTAPERIWLQVGDKAHYHSEPFPRDTSEVSWCADSVVGCEVPYVRADLAGQLPVVPMHGCIVGKTTSLGWQPVPVEATRAMIDAAILVEEDGYAAMHSAMLAAAQKPEGGA